MILITLLLLVLFPTTTLAGTATPEEPYGETAVSMTYMPSYTIPSDIPYDPSFRMNIGGQVQYSDTSPFSHGFMELHSTVKRTMTDGEGSFAIGSVEQGAHSLYAINQANAPQGTLNFRIDRTNTVAGTALVALPDGTTEILINGRVTAMYLRLALDGNGNLILLNAQPTGWLSNGTENTKTWLNPKTGALSNQASAPCAVLLLSTLSVGIGWRFRKNKTL